MRKYLIGVCAMAVALCASNCKASDSGISFDGSKGGGIQLSLPAPSAPQAVPARSRQIEYYVQDVDKMNQVLDQTIAYAEQHNSAELVGGLRRLRLNGTPGQKAAFVYGPGVYVLPEEFNAPAPAAKGIIGCIEKLVCHMVTETIIKWACDSAGKCMNQPVQVLREACETICEEQ